ncbi:hypothetical protein KUV89_10955 [Marinobacter hydrocarbonoclasticus]|nr:hypothetical protein [Marinobacter nauticus]
MQKGIIMAVMLLTGCSTTENFRGYLDYGTESMVFRDCRSGEFYWLGTTGGAPAQWAAIHAIVNDVSGCAGERWQCPTPDAPVAVVGRLSEPGQHGPFGQTGRKLDILEVTLLDSNACQP